jgi:hypothetical protein
VNALLDSGLWEPQQLCLATPGFRLYLIRLLLCQHFYLVANAREQHLPLLRVEAAFRVTTSGSGWPIARFPATCPIGCALGHVALQRRCTATAPSGTGRIQWRRQAWNAP